jgi:hypothetical protein
MSSQCEAVGKEEDREQRRKQQEREAQWKRSARSSPHSMRTRKQKTNQVCSIKFNRRTTYCRKQRERRSAEAAVVPHQDTHGLS